jgi:hypothetical protein
MAGQTITVGRLRQRIDGALRDLGLATEVRSVPLRDELPRFGADANLWRELAEDQPVVPSALWEDFPDGPPWDGLEVLGFGGRLDDPIPNVTLDELRGEPHRYGVVFEDCAALTWRQVLWVGAEPVRIVQESIHYQRRQPNEQDWICRYDLQPLRAKAENRDYAKQPVSHLHVGRLGDGNRKLHLPARHMDLFTMFWWVVSVFDASVGWRVQQRLHEEEGKEQLRRRLRELLQAPFDLLSPGPPLP